MFFSIYELHYLFVISRQYLVLRVIGYIGMNEWNKSKIYHRSAPLKKWYSCATCENVPGWSLYDPL